MNCIKPSAPKIKLRDGLTLVAAVVGAWARTLAAPAFIANTKEGDRLNCFYAQDVPVNRHVVHDADHSFSEPWMRRPLFKETLKWFGKY